MGQDRHIVVVVDDETDLLELICQILEEEGYAVRRLSDPRSALTLPPVPQPALFLVDLMLPGMTGIDLAAKLREYGFANVPLIAMSASNSMLQRAKQSGLFRALLPKPFDLSVLLDQIGQYA
ncbi:MAG TPA: response regulator [Chloroflexota bacterium]